MKLGLGLIISFARVMYVIDFKFYKRNSLQAEQRTNLLLFELTGFNSKSLVFNNL